MAILDASSGIEVYKKAPRKDIESITVIQEEYIHFWTERIAQTLFNGVKLP